MAGKGSFAGLRIRERRRSLGLSQTALAGAAGISPSYLNLIEHNKRGIAGRVLIALADALELPPSALSKEAEMSLISDLRHAADATDFSDAETDVTEEFVSRYPGWARLLDTLYRSNEHQRASMEAMTNRLTHDPVLQETVHEMLTRVTAVHSTAGILQEAEDLPADRRTRFLRNLYAEGDRLADVAAELASYFDRTVEIDQNPTLPGLALERFLEQRKYRIEELEGANDVEHAIADLIAQEPSLSDGETRTEAEAAFRLYADDAAAMPKEAFLHEALRSYYDPLVLSHRFNAPVDAVLRRLATLPRSSAERDDPLFGLIRVNGAGHVVDRQPISGFPTPRPGVPCEHWPLFQALHDVGRLFTGSIDLPNGLAFETVAVAVRENPKTLSDRPSLMSTMLIAVRGDAEEFAFAKR
ncbi:MAG: helix-turn-helix domain-containing protein [Pseudomonadota bacterium]